VELPHLGIFILFVNAPCPKCLCFCFGCRWGPMRFSGGWPREYGSTELSVETGVRQRHGDYFRIFFKEKNLPRYKTIRYLLPPQCGGILTVISFLKNSTIFFLYFGLKAEGRWGITPNHGDFLKIPLGQFERRFQKKWELLLNWYTQKLGGAEIFIKKIRKKGWCRKYPEKEPSPWGFHHFEYHRPSYYLGLRLRES